MDALAGLAAALGPLIVSSPYRSAAVPAADQPEFLNAVARGRSDLAPEAIAALAKAAEHRAGRRRASRWAPRILDVDLLLAAGVERRAPELTLPHPRLRERAFVLVPLAELLPGLRLPPDGATAAELLARLPGEQAIERQSWQVPFPRAVHSAAAPPCCSTPR